jgi:hypothetical protein
MANVARATETVCQPWYTLSSHNLNKRERANVNAHEDCRHSSASSADYWAVAPRHSGRVSVGWPLAPCADAARHGRVFRRLRRSYLCSATAVPITGGYCWQIYFKVLEVLFLRQFPKRFCLPRRHMGYTNFSTSGFANSIRVFFDRGLLAGHGNQLCETNRVG